MNLSRISPSVLRDYLGGLRSQIVESLSGRPLPAPSEIIDNPKAWMGSGPQPDSGKDHGNER